MIWKLIALTALASIAACTAPVPAPQASATQIPTGDLCQADTTRFAVGQKLTPLLAEEARKSAGALTVRVIRPGQAVTMDFNPHRLNLDVNGSDVVIAARCG